ncbi:MAG: hypothetical protein K0R65_2025 [Crocinitomicaceae bacterium]|jgi:tetratricopeptide (TPR) repeat protein|nr:hypothetical protein [Crocinitomicaceae bacterium]
MKTIKTLLFVALSGLTFGQGLKVPVKSPMATIKQAVGISDITVEYCRPSKNGRVVFGDVVPFDEVWRTGANASTKVTFGEDVKINGQALKAGTYSLYTIPKKDEWVVIFNKNLTLWGSDGYTESEDAARILVKTQKTAELVETFTIAFNNLKPTAATMDLTWENTKVSLDLSVEVDEKIMKNIEATMSQDKRPFYQAASYYYDNKKDMKQALEWANKAVESNPKAYWTLVLKSKIQLELNDKKGAKETAEAAKKMAEEEKDQAYAKQADEIIKKASAK